jgi:hypothetical protein
LGRSIAWDMYLNVSNTSVVVGSRDMNSGPR